MPSKVYLIGAGPGAPDLLTLRAQNILKKADVILYDFLVSKDTLKNAPKNAKLICVGKRKGHHAKTQEQINQLMSEKSKKFKTVVRLKGGTPFLFGKGFEEAEYLAKNKIDFEVTPGVSSATAVPESFLIPLTYTREFKSIALASGHWDNLADMPVPQADTLIYFMGAANLSLIIQKLKKTGFTANTPCAILSCGTLKNAKKITGTLENILKKIDKVNGEAREGALGQNRKIETPALFMVGEILEKTKP